MFLGLADVEANYTIVKAYQYTTLTSVQVRTSISILNCCFDCGFGLISEMRFIGQTWKLFKPEKAFQYLFSLQYREEHPASRVTFPGSRENWLILPGANS